MGFGRGKGFTSVGRLTSFFTKYEAGPSGGATIRKWDTVYRNTSGRPYIVTVWADMDVGKEATSFEGSYILEAFVSASSNPSTDGIPVAQIGIDVALSGLASAVHLINPRSSMSFVVPDDFYYMVRADISDDASLTAAYWTEAEVYISPFTEG